MKDITLDKNAVIIGHSLGAVLALRIAEQRKIGKLILVSGWDFWDLTPEHRTFFKTLISHKKIKANTKEIRVIHSDNDPYVTTFTAKEFSKRLRAKFILVKNKGHFTKKDGVRRLEEILEEFND